MKRLMFAMACVAGCVITGRMAAAAAAERQPLVVVRGPTVVAFFEPVTEADLEKDPDANEALADFQFYATKVREPLRKAGIEFHELYARSFRLRVGKTLTTFRPAEVTVGYCLVEPGKKPRIEYGVMTDLDLLQVANEYFGITAEGGRSAGAPLSSLPKAGAQPHGEEPYKFPVSSFQFPEKTGQGL